MKLTADVEGIHEGQPMNVKISVEFDKGEYLSVVKEMPAIMAQVKSLIKAKKKG